MENWGEGQAKGGSLKLGHRQHQPITVPFDKEVICVAWFRILVRKVTAEMEGICT